MATPPHHSPILIAGGRVVEEDGTTSEDILIENGSVAARGEALEAPAGADVVDAAGKYVFPGFIDMHVHLREPGREDKETIITGTRAAVMGGFTSVCAKANTFLVMDNPAVVEFVHSRAEAAAFAHVFPVGSVTEGLRGHGSLSEIGSLKEAGVVALSDDGVPVVGSDVMVAALRYAADYGLPLIAHSEDYALSAGGFITEGPVSSGTGLAGIPAEAEEAMIARDIALLRQAGGKLHAAHVSTAASLEHIRRAKAEGLDVTCETTPHYLLLTAEAAAAFDADAKMNPPLRSEEDRQAILAGVVDGTIDCIATDHAPHTPAEKDKEFAAAPFGVVGLETALRLIYTYLVLTGVISLERMVELMSANPARRLYLEGRGTLARGARGDVTVFEPEAEDTVRSALFYSKGKNTPFERWRVRGRVDAVLVDGWPVLREGRLVETDGRAGKE
ncbi:MAG: amidohydrolase family protein [candidate division Zixibacteria bacterium]|nr:amidohydrolase family protein [candidate division Zixibacteria bacterium]